MKIENLGPFLSRSLFPRNFGVFWNSGKLRISEFRKNFPEKSAWSLENSGKHVYSCIFSYFCRRKFPGILEKGDPRFRWKLEIVVDLFRGKIWIGSREFRETRIFLHFYTLYRTQLPGISEKRVLDFRENWKFWRTPKNLGFLEFWWPTIFFSDFMKT